MLFSGFPKVALLSAFAFFSNHGLSLAASEDPTRFLAVTNWYATFTRTLRSAGVGDGVCHTEWSFSHSGEIKTELPLLPGIHGIPGLPDIPPRWTDIGKTNQSLVFQLHDTGTETCGDESDVYRADAPGKMQVYQSAVLQLDTTATNYTLGLGYFVGPYDATVNGDPFPPTTLAWTAGSQGIITEPLPASGMILQGQRSYPVDQITVYDGILTIASSALGNELELLHGELVIGWTLTPVLEEVEVVVDGPDYEDWLPKGDVKDWTKGGDTLYLTASLQTKDGNIPLAARAKNFKFELLNVSTEKGVCLNRPHEEFADTKADLKFVAQSNQPPLVAFPLQIDNGGMTATTADGQYLIATAGVSSFDFGAYGEIKVTATVNGTNIVGYYKKDSTKTKPILLPKRQPNSFIADKWKKDHGVTGLADDDDAENEPVGDSHTGDGFSLYEEYRGFSQNLTHIRLDPKKKDFFILDRMKTSDSLLGIAMFTDGTGLNVHSRMLAEEFHAALGANGELFDTLVNFNHSNGPHTIDQHGIAIIRSPTAKGRSYAGTDPKIENRGQGGTPGHYLTVTIDPASSGWKRVDTGNGHSQIRPVGAADIAHELSHTCAVWHHGDSDGDPVLWQIINSEVFEYGLQIEPRRENNTLMAIVFQEGSSSAALVIGAPQGQHSGDDNCYMRYYTSEAYRSAVNNKVRYLVDEAPGLALCNSSKGSGVNAAGRSPQSRYGDAAANRGNCKAQLCVSDVYDGKHQR
jgi:hypothetical protein